MSTYFVVLKSVLSLWALLLLGISIKGVSSTSTVGVTDGRLNGTKLWSIPSERSKLGYVDDFFSHCTKSFDCPINAVCGGDSCFCQLNYKLKNDRGNSHHCEMIDCKQTADCTEWHSNTVCDGTCVCAEGYVENVLGYDCYKRSTVKWVLIGIGTILAVILLCCCLAYLGSNSNKKQQAQNAQAGTASYPTAPSGSKVRAPSASSGSYQQAGAPYQGAAAYPAAPYPGPPGPGYGYPQANGYPPYGGNPPPPGYAPPPGGYR